MKKQKRTKKPKVTPISTNPNTSYTGTTGPTGYIVWVSTSRKSFVQTTLAYLKGWFR